MLAGWIWSSPIGCGDRISRPSATASRSSCDGIRPVVRSDSAASGVGNSVSSRASVIGQSYAQARLLHLSQTLLRGNTVSPHALASARMRVRYSRREMRADGEGNANPRRVCRHGRQHAADQVAARLGRDRLHDPRQGRVPEPRRLGQGPRGARHHQGRRGARRCCRPGGVIVEGTAGNTGIGLALVGNARGYRTVIVMPETQSQEKKDMLLLCGADLRLVPAVPYTNPMQLRALFRAARRGDRGRASRTARSGPTSSTTSPTAAAITRRPAPRSGTQTEGKVDGFTCSVGTGGTLSGVGIALKERNPKVQIYLSDRMGSGIYSWYARREFKPEGNSITEGIGNNRETKNLEGFAPDGQFQITDAEMLPVLFDLVAGGGAGARRLDRRSMSAARSASRASSGPATRSSRSSPIPAPAISRSCSTRPS